MPDYVEMEHARSEEQRSVMEQIKLDGVCPFCPEHISRYHTHPIQVEEHWLWTLSRWPYKSTALHIMVISRAHAENLGDLPDGAGDELLTILKQLETDRNISSGAAFIRFGDPQYNGGSVRHLHVHMIVPDLGQEGWDKIKVTLGKNKKGEKTD
jgi:diadenosine tetraphosphate (Ap4A) HIT family hydrolase